MTGVKLIKTCGGYLSMFNNIWNTLSSNIWPFTIAILNLWAIGKAIWFVITFIIGVAKGAKD